MIWTGLVIGTFIVYHLIHFTFHIGAPGIPPGQHMHLDEMGRHDVFTMVVLSFGHSVIVAAYLAGISALGLHLFHGIQSLLQSLGLNNDRTLPVMKKTGRIAAALLYLAYITIPLVIYIGILKPAVSNHGH
jgi:succinate dehydrogenase / fumarate reductase cytochrome b subunit